jgi:hypothetical protein
VSQNDGSTWFAALKAFFEKDDGESALSGDVDRYFDGTGFNLSGGKGLPPRAFKFSRAQANVGSRHSNGRKP